MLEQEHYDIDSIPSKARSTLRNYADEVDGRIHDIDFPFSTTVLNSVP